MNHEPITNEAVRNELRVIRGRLDAINASARANYEDARLQAERLAAIAQNVEHYDIARAGELVAGAVAVSKDAVREAEHAILAIDRGLERGEEVTHGTEVPQAGD
jgi:ferritin-like metal-binding protein YciE